MTSTAVRPAPGPEPTTDAGADPSARGGSSRQGLGRLWRGPADDPAWARPALLLLLAATLAAYTWDLAASGWANAFYSAAAQAGSQSWEAFFYGSSDAGNAITVDKPPASLWVMALSVRLFGLSSWSILLPQALMGVATVALVHASVKRYAGAGAGLLAGLVLALTPVAALMFRFNNPDALLVLAMTAAAWATLRAIERGSARWFALAGVLIGLGFLTKTLQVLLVVPFLGIAFLVCANTTLRRRVIGALAGTAAAVLAAGWWVAIVELVPASLRPYIGGSQDNSFLELTFGYNGFGRLNGEETGSVGGGNGWGTPGVTRLFIDTAAGQISWLLPAAILALLLGLAWRGRAPVTDMRRASYLVWGGWLAVTAATFSLMAGIFHDYYTVALAPAIAALVGLGAGEAWERRSRLSARLALAAGVAVTAGWSFVLLSSTEAYGPGLRVLVLLAGLGATAGLLLLGTRGGALRSATVGAALVATLAGPLAWTATTVTTPQSGSIVTAGPSDASSGRGGGPRGGGGPGRGPGPTGLGGGALPQAPGGIGGFGAGGGPGGGMGGLLDASTPDEEVVAALRADADSYTWAAAAIGSQNAAGLQLGSGRPVMAIGGFNGSDPSPTLTQFQQYVQQGRIHYFLAGTGFGGRGGNGSGTGTEISSWVSENFSSVTIGDQTFYDLTSPVTGGSGGIAG